MVRDEKLDKVNYENIVREENIVLRRRRNIQLDQVYCA